MFWFEGSLGLWGGEPVIWTWGLRRVDFCGVFFVWVFGVFWGFFSCLVWVSFCLVGLEGVFVGFFSSPSGGALGPFRAIS